jgi:hypothetical protein
MSSPTQQKTQKRRKATQDQLRTLEEEFNKNSAPTTTVRKRIAEDINMTERSVQIWFQNRCVLLLLYETDYIESNKYIRRAKKKLLAKKSIETKEDIDNILGPQGNVGMLLE